MNVQEINLMISQLELFLYGPEGLKLTSDQKERIAAEIDRWNLVLQVIDAFSYVPGKWSTLEDQAFARLKIKSVIPLLNYQVAKTLKNIKL